MDDFLEDLREMICVYDIKENLIYRNRVAEKYCLVEPELKYYFDNMIESRKDMMICKSNGIEILICYLGNCNEGEMFYLNPTKELEDSIFKMESIRSLKNELDTILDAIHDDILITDRDGIITKVYPSFEKVYNIKKEEAEGKSVYELEKEGVFKPSVTAKVLEKKQQITMMQETEGGKKLIVTAIPVKNPQGQIIKVISFTRDVTDFLVLKEQYALLQNKLEKYSAEIKELREKNVTYPSIISNSKKIQDIINLIDRVSKFDTNILIEGESGVGKTMFARMIHKKSSRAKGPLIEIDCGAIPTNLLESELFGYEKGSFTGANTKGKIGLIELADTGTLFLDEIGELPINLQMKLLKVIQDKKFKRIGGTENIEVDFRLISATNKKLKDLINKGKFRKDLYYRINVIFIDIPPLRERRDDIIHLSMYFIEKYNKKYSLAKSCSPDVFDIFTKYKWPGNIRELENLIERMIITADKEVIETSQIPHNIRLQDAEESHYDTLQKALEEYEKKLVIEAYNKYKSTVGVAKSLGISQPTAVRKIKKYVSQ